MNKIAKIALSSLLVLSVGSTIASASAAKGQKLYKRYLKKACGMNGAKFSARHTQDGWAKIGVKGLAKEIKSVCPKVKTRALKPRYLKDYYDFFYNYASDSGNVPSC